MRQNGFGDTYCHTAAEARRKIDMNPEGWEVYATQFDPPEGKDNATAEIRTNQDGDLVCYIEADTTDAVKAIVKELKIETT